MSNGGNAAPGPQHREETFGHLNCQPPLLAGLPLRGEQPLAPGKQRVSNRNVKMLVGVRELVQVLPGNLQFYAAKEQIGLRAMSFNLHS